MVGHGWHSSLQYGVPVAAQVAVNVGVRVMVGVELTVAVGPVGDGVGTGVSVSVATGVADGTNGGVALGGGGDAVATRVDVAVAAALPVGTPVGVASVAVPVGTPVGVLIPTVEVTVAAEGSGLGVTDPATVRVADAVGLAGGCPPPPPPPQPAAAMISTARMANSLSSGHPPSRIRQPLCVLARGEHSGAAFHRGDDGARRGDRIGGVANRAADDEIVGAGAHRRLRRHHALLVVHGAARRTNAGRNDEEFAPALLTDALHLVRRGDDAVHAGLARQTRQTHDVALDPAAHAEAANRRGRG